MIILLPILALVVPLILAYYITWSERHGLVIVMLLIFCVLMGWGIWRGNQEHGFNGIGYAIFAALVAAPAIIGTGIGWLIGWFSNRRHRAHLAKSSQPE